MMSAPLDITGERYGRLVVLERAGHSSNGNLHWLCQCDCGNQTVVDSYRLRHGGVRSCGCLRREQSRKNILANPKTAAKMRRGDAHKKRMG
ncbi:MULTISPECIES: hypothetical protein [unclassified Lacticaseibacillus]|uniref:hypothetical protein n=1 Tax=unclassified Lacticaseibacillus TaxID=2759744 RepID=UPI0019448304|nr:MULTISPECIES: hypothetical protein [unclassified Lacticaseibacillus]